MTSQSGDATYVQKNHLSNVPNTLPVSSDVQVVESNPLSYQNRTYLGVCFVLQVPTKINLVAFLSSEELLIAENIHFSPRTHLLQGAFISLIRKPLAKKTLFILCSEYSYSGTYSEAYAD